MHSNSWSIPPLCHKLLMDDATPRKGCGCLPPKARITDGQWVLPLNTRCPWLVCPLILYQWLCKRCAAIIHTDEWAAYSITGFQRLAHEFCSVSIALNAVMTARLAAWMEKVLFFKDCCTNAPKKKCSEDPMGHNQSRQVLLLCSTSSVSQFVTTTAFWTFL